MKLKKSKYQGDLGYQIKVDCLRDFIDRYCMDIINEDEQKIGEVMGYVLHVKSIKYDMEINNGRESFIALDSLSQLCCHVWEFLATHTILLEENKVYFLNRFSFIPEYGTLERDQELLLILQKKMGAIIYSCGSTELEDDFPEEPYEMYWEDHMSMLAETGWDYDEEFSFYTKRNAENKFNGKKDLLNKTRGVL